MIPRNYARTLAALAAYDVHAAKRPLSSDRDAIWDPWWSREDALAEAVGRAYGLDTADINKLDDCVKLIRPGPQVPPPGCEVSFVRRMVAAHDASVPPVEKAVSDGRQ